MNEENERDCFHCEEHKVYNLDIYCEQCLWDIHLNRNWYAKIRKK
jgi:hypothetical protein